MVRDRFFPSKLSSFTLPPAAMSTMFIIYMALNLALAFLTLLSPIFGLMGVLVLNLIVLFFIQPRLALPLYILVAGPTVVLSVTSSGILSRLYLGNLLFALIVVIWLLQGGLSERKAGTTRGEASILIPPVIYRIFVLVASFSETSRALIRNQSLTETLPSYYC